MNPIKAISSLILIFTMLFSAAEVNRIGLFVFAHYTGNSCTNILCTCGSGCACSHTSDSNADSPVPVNAAGIPLIAPTLSSGSDSENALCCSGTDASQPDDSQTSETKLATAQGAQLCSCGHHDPADTSGTIKPLDKVTLAVGMLLQKPELRPNKLPSITQSTHPAFPDEVFHPPTV
ncbi:hypothetical protein [Cyclonatronum proteinivorum]|uniref:hypothetical protein n=1 Tax=Cyclonatronum proteinivorum TaxID=1457365 RepID=UPI000E0F89F0|nr:hypothetical protein [Cyclonatronum proteinivorum]